MSLHFLVFTGNPKTELLYRFIVSMINDSIPSSSHCLNLLTNFYRNNNYSSTTYTVWTPFTNSSVQPFTRMVKLKFSITKERNFLCVNSKWPYLCRKRRHVFTYINGSLPQIVSFSSWRFWCASLLNRVSCVLCFFYTKLWYELPVHDDSSIYSTRDSLDDFWFFNFLSYL